MKCIKFTASVTLRSGEISRVTDEEAHAAVKAGVAKYVSKTEWKNFLNRGA